MRLTLALYGFLLLIIPAEWAARAQQAVPSKKALTAEQQEYQRKWREYMAKRPSLQEHAKQIFDAEMAREKAGDCPNAITTYDINVCLGKEVSITDQNLNQYKAIIRELIASAPEEPGGPGVGPAGPALTSAESAEEFDHVQQTWSEYRKVACKAARDAMGGGTAAPASEMQCDLLLGRGHMRELNSIYWLELHK
jgi:uncharacterized protein YecT (DUF1311 family)